MQEGYVYLMTDWGSTPEKFKIGITKNDPKIRLKQHQTSSANEIVLLRKYKSKNYRKIETNLKKVYKQYSTEGGTEWYELPNDIVVNFINECKKVDEMFELLKDNPFMK